MKKLNKEEIEKKAKYYKKRSEYYNKKLQDVKKEDRVIGFKFY